MYSHWNKLNIHCHVGTIGAVFDFFVWRRCIIGNSLFLWNMVKEAQGFENLPVPSLPLKKEFFLPLRLSCKESSTFLTKPLFNSLYDPFGSPYRGQKPSGTRGCNRPPVLYLPHLSSIVFTTPSVPLVGDRNPSGRVLTLYPSPKSLPQGLGM